MTGTLSFLVALLRESTECSGSGVCVCASMGEIVPPQWAPFNAFHPINTKY